MIRIRRNVLRDFLSEENPMEIDSVTYTLDTKRVTFIKLKRQVSHDILSNNVSSLSLSLTHSMQQWMYFYILSTCLINRTVDSARLNSMTIC